MNKGIFTAAIVTSLGWSLPAGADNAAPAPAELFKKLDANGDGKLTASEISQEHKKSFERLLRIGDADKNGELTRDEFDRAIKQRDEPVIDISKAAGLGPGNGPRPNFDPQRMFQMLDKNKDGKLTREEAADRPRIKALFDHLGKDELTLDDFRGAGPRAGRQEAQAKKPEGKSKKSDGKSKKHQAEAKKPDTEQPRADAADAAPPSTAEAMKAARLARAGRRRALRGPAGLGFARKAATAQGHPNLAEMLKNADTNGDGKLSKDEAPPFLREHFAKIDKNHDGFLEKGELEEAFKHLRHHKKPGSPPGGTTPQQNASGQ